MLFNVKHSDTIILRRKSLRKRHRNFGRKTHLLKSMLKTSLKDKEPSQRLSSLFARRLANGLTLTWGIMPHLPRSTLRIKRNLLNLTKDSVMLRTLLLRSNSSLRAPVKISSKLSSTVFKERSICTVRSCSRSTSPHLRLSCLTPRLNSKSLGMKSSTSSVSIMTSSQLVSWWTTS